MKQVTATGHTVKEAVESALAQLNTTEDRSSGLSISQHDTYQQPA